MTPHFIKSGLCLCCLLVVYHFLLSKEKMYRFNRFYLLTAIVFSLLIPFNTLTETVSAAAKTPVVTAALYARAIADDSFLNLENGLIAVYLLVSGLLFFRFTMNLNSLFRKIRSGEQIKQDSQTLVLIPDKVLPFTFLHYIFINKKQIRKNKIEPELLLHETAHARQMHSLDILFIELLQIFLWFQPLLYFYKKAIRLNHEFLADEAVTQKHTEVTDYQNLILSKVATEKPMALTSNLAYLVTKKRFIMMTKTSPPLRLTLIKLCMIPLMSGMVFLFSTKVVAQEKPAAKTTKNNGSKPLPPPTPPTPPPAPQLPPPPPPVEARPKKAASKNGKAELPPPPPPRESSKKTTSNNGKDKLLPPPPPPAEPRPKKTALNEFPSPPAPGTTIPEFAGGMNAWNVYVQKNLKIPENFPKSDTPQRIAVRFVVEKDGSTSNVAIVKDPTNIMKESITTLIESSPKWVPGKSEGKAIRSEFYLPLMVLHK